MNVSLDDPVVRVVNLSKRFPNGATALDAVTFDVPRGYLLALVGLSGSGKSTLLRHLSGDQLPTGGHVEVLGIDLTQARRQELRDVRRRVGVVAQVPALVGRSSCLENVLVGAIGRVRGPRWSELSYPRELRREAMGLLDRVGLADRAFQRAGTLQPADRQCLAIARALMQQPALVLADEPVTSLDAAGSARVMDVLFRLVLEDRLSVVCTLHDPALAFSWANRVIALRDGKVVLDQPVDAVDPGKLAAALRSRDPHVLAHLG